MGSDDLHKKRKNRAGIKSRRQSKRLLIKRTLITCEDSVSSVRYFQGIIKDKYKADPGAVVIDGNCGSNPMAVYEHAKKLHDKSKDDNPFGSIFIVIDQDRHQDLDQAIESIRQKIANLNDKTCEWRLIISVPCFEYWLLLHFSDSTKSYVEQGGKSPCQSLISIGLKKQKEMKNYDKGKIEDVLPILLPKTEIAIKNADKVSKVLKFEELPNPSTKIHELVKHIRDLNKPK